MDKQLTKLIKALNKEIVKAEAFAKKTHSAAVEVSKSAAASPSQSGDRVHAVNQAAINADRLERLQDAKNELKTKPIFIEGYFVMKNPVFIPGFKIVSSASPKGKLLLKKG